LAPFLYLFIADSLGYLLENHGVEGLKLPDSDASITDQEFADDANLYLAGYKDNLDRAKSALDLFALASGSKVNWHKSNAIWVSNSPHTFEWGTEMLLHWLEQGESIRYLGFPLGSKIPTEQRFNSALQSLKNKLAYWGTTKLSLASRVLIANQVLLASIWFLASCWALHIDTLKQIKSLIRNFAWSGENGKRCCRAKVEWDSLIQPKHEGGIKLIDPTTQMQALLVKLLVRGLTPGNAPWKTLILYRMKSIRPKKGGQTDS